MNTALASSKPAPPGSPPREGYLIFELEGHSCALRLAEVEEIVPMAALSGQAGAPPLLAGFLNLGGRAVPTLYLSRLLEMPAPALDLNAQVIIVRSGEEYFGLIVSKVLHVALAPASDLVAVSGLTAAKAALKLGEQILPLVGVDELVLEQERRCLAELRAAHERRLGELLGVAA
jgi:purine-binding chemotaxis protein CheW